MLLAVEKCLHKLQPMMMCIGCTLVMCMGCSDTDVLLASCNAVVIARRTWQ